MSEEMVRCEHNETAIIVISAVSLPMARIIKDEITDAVIYAKEETKADDIRKNLVHQAFACA